MPDPTEPPSDHDPDPVDDRAAFAAACADLLGHHYPMSDRQLALAALAVMCARTPAGAPLDRALRMFVTACAPMVGAPDNLHAAKRRALEGALALGSALVIVDPSAGCDLPEHLLGDPEVTLRLGYALTPPIDLSLDETGFSAVLSFHRRPRAVRVPWSAVLGVGSEVTREGVRWGGPAPADSSGANRTEPEADLKTEPPGASAPTKPKLSLVPEDPKPDPKPEEPKDEDLSFPGAYP